MLVLTWLACASPEPIDLGEPWLELGAGQTAFEPLQDDDVVELVAGPQGGWHVDVSVRFGGMWPDGVTLTYGAWLDDALVSFESSAQLSENSVLVIDDGWERVADRIVFDIAETSEVVGQTLELRLACTSEQGDLADVRQVALVDEQ